MIVSGRAAGESRAFFFPPTLLSPPLLFFPPSLFSPFLAPLSPVAAEFALDNSTGERREIDAPWKPRLLASNRQTGTAASTRGSVLLPRTGCRANRAAAALPRAGSIGNDATKHRRCDSVIHRRRRIRDFDNAREKTSARGGKRLGPYRRNFSRERRFIIPIEKNKAVRSRPIELGRSLRPR